MWAILLCLLVEAAISTPPSDPAGEAFIWGYPLWHMANQRYQSASNSPAFFQQNIFQVRVSQQSPPFISVCNAQLCAGAPNPYNPSPVVSPNVDTIYGGATMDLNNGGTYILNVTNPSPFITPLGFRYFIVIFYDFYGNVLNEASILTLPTGGVLCLSQSAGSTAPCGAIPVALNVQLPRFSQFVIRAYTTGVPFPPGYPQCGDTGCEFFSIQLYPFVPASSILNVVSVYGPLMSSGNCSYVYGQPLCGTNGNPSRFWDGVCQALSENPVSGPEADYVNANFASLGITSTGCSNLNYPVLNAALSLANPNSGYSNLANNLGSTYFVFAPWVYLNFSGSWGTDFYTRAQTSYRLELMVDNNNAAYFTAFTDTSGVSLNAAWGATYKLVWQSSLPFFNLTNGFWSVTLYDQTFYLYAPSADLKQYAIRGIVPPVSGTEIHISNTCVNSNCIRAPPGAFNLILRAYSPLSNVLPTSSATQYPLPTITKCSCSSPCN